MLSNNIFLIKYICLKLYNKGNLRLLHQAHMFSVTDCYD